MISIKINDFEMDLKDINTSWLSQHFHARRESDEYLCVIVRIEEQDTLMTLTTTGCRDSKLGTRQPNKKEREILNIWKECRLNEVNFSFDNILHFIHKMKNMF